ncbi:hypothetical protein BGY98DRAFT_1115719, partial [Russula aff. rugulosa BPL654]
TIDIPLPIPSIPVFTVFTDGPEPAFSGNVDALLSTTERARRNAWIAHVESFLRDRVSRSIAFLQTMSASCIPPYLLSTKFPKLLINILTGAIIHNGDAQRNMSRTLCPVFFTCSRLANTFGCSPSFVSYVAPLSPSQQRATLAKRDREHEKARARWGEKAALIREIRKKQKEFW